MAARVGLKPNDSGLMSPRTRACQCLSLACKSACGLTNPYDISSNEVCCR